MAKHLHDLIKDNNYKPNELATSWYHVVSNQYSIDLNIDYGRGFCFDFFILIFKPLNCYWSKKKVLPSMSIMGSFLWFYMKDYDTYETVVLKVTFKIYLLHILEKLASLTAWVKACIVTFCLNVDNTSKRTDSCNTNLTRKIFQKIHAETWFVLVLLIISSW